MIETWYFYLLEFVVAGIEYSIGVGNIDYVHSCIVKYDMHKNVTMMLE